MYSFGCGTRIGQDALADSDVADALAAAVESDPYAIGQSLAGGSGIDENTFVVGDDFDHAYLFGPAMIVGFDVGCRA